jgi:hypothetical protein
MNAHEKGIAQATEVISAAHAYQLSYEAVEAGLRAYLKASGMVMVPKRPIPEMIADAWGEWKVRNPRPIGPGPGFVEAITAAIAAAPSPFSQANTEG